MKLMTFLKLVDKIVLINYELLHNKNKSYDKTSNVLSTGLKFNVSIDFARAQLEVLVGTGYHRLVNLYYWSEMDNSLRNDNYLKVCTNLPSFFSNKIHREKDGVLFMAANTFPVLPHGQCFDEDVLEPLMFQLMTMYTENEVQSMVAVRYLCPDLTSAEREAKKHFPLLGLDLTALSFLSEEEILELIDYIDGVFDVASTTNV